MTEEGQEGKLFGDWVLLDPQRHVNTYRSLDMSLTVGLLVTEVNCSLSLAASGHVLNCESEKDNMERKGGHTSP